MSVNANEDASSCKEIDIAIISDSISFIEFIAQPLGNCDFPSDLSLTTLTCSGAGGCKYMQLFA
jgi:hypothetical protein